MAKIIKQVTVQAATTIHANATTIATIVCDHYDRLILYPSYVKGDETGVYISLWFSGERGGTAIQDATWSIDADRTITYHRYYLTASGGGPIVLDITGHCEIVVKDDANGGTPTGTLALSYTLARTI